MLVLMSCLQSATAQVTEPLKSIPYAIAGKWESLQWTLDVWVLDLKTSETKLTGTVSITPGPGRPPSRPADIYDGKIDKNQIEFKVKSPDNMRVITFSGTVTGSEIRFTRKVEMQPGASTGGDDLLGSEGPQTFVVKRVRSVSKSHIDQ
jgi:hypothetical protein